DGDQLPGYASVPREKQKRATSFILEQLKDMTWLDDEELLKGFELRSNISTVLEDRVFKGLMGCLRVIGISAGKAGKDAYTRTEFLDDVTDCVWKPTRQNKSLTNLEKKLQIRFLSHLISTAGIANKTMNGGSLGIASAERMIQIPECIKAQSRAAYGLLPEEIMGVFSNREGESQAQRDVRPEEVMGFGFNVSLTDVIEPMDHIYYEKLKQAQTLLKQKANTGNADTQKHYRLLLYKIGKALNN
ncbi:MAG: zinc-dependent metalloprotease, partial [Butyricimonas faecihominis]